MMMTTTDMSAACRTDLRREDDDCSADEQHHEEFAWPDVWTDVSVADRRECDDDEPERVEQREVLSAASLQMLNPAYTVHTHNT